MKAFAILIIKIWCMHLAYVHKLAESNNAVIYLLVRQNLFDRNIGAKGMKDSKKMVRALLTMITRKNRPTKIWLDKRTEFAREFQKVFSAKGIQIYSTLSETKTAFAERTIRSLKNILYRYMEDHGYKYNHKLSQLVTTVKYGKKCSIDLIPKNVKTLDFFPFCTANHYENSENPIRISKYELPDRKGYKPQFTQVLEIVPISSRNFIIF